jgi:hypothetical protein
MFCSHPIQMELDHLEYNFDPSVPHKVRNDNRLIIPTCALCRHRLFPRVRGRRTNDHTLYSTSHLSCTHRLVRRILRQRSPLVDESASRDRLARNKFSYTALRDARGSLQRPKCHATDVAHDEGFERAGSAGSGDSEGDVDRKPVVRSQELIWRHEPENILIDK